MDDPSVAVTRAWIDKSELAELVAVLSSAVDRGDHDRIVACYADDSYDDHGVFKGTGWEFADFVCGPGEISSMHHLLGQSVFEVKDDEAWGETFFIFHGVAGAASLSGYGRYVDHFQKIGGTWKLKYRRVVPDDAPDADNADAYWKPSCDRSDPSYDRHRWPEEANPGG